MREWMMAALTATMLAGGSGAAEAGCARSVTNRTPYLVTFSQDGGPAVLVSPRHPRAIRYDAPGHVSVSVFCPTGAGVYADVAAKPVFTASYATMAVLDRCYVDIDGGGTEPVALNNPRQGDIVVAPYGVSCPLPPRGNTISARY